MSSRIVTALVMGQVADTGGQPAVLLRDADPAGGRGSSEKIVVGQAGQASVDTDEVAGQDVSVRSGEESERPRPAGQGVAVLIVHGFPPVGARVTVYLHDESPVVSTLAEGLTITVYRSGSDSVR